MKICENVGKHEKIPENHRKSARYLLTGRLFHWTVPRPLVYSQAISNFPGKTPPCQLPDIERPVYSDTQPLQRSYPWSLALSRVL